jgi:hypothetical protein
VTEQNPPRRPAATWPRRVYLETSAVIGPGWPPWHGKIEALASLVATLGATLILPTCVEREAEEHYIREARKDDDKMKSLLERVPPGVRRELASMDHVRDAYRAAREEWKTSLGIQPCPITTCSVTDLFEEAITYQSPFKEDGGGIGFQDAVIFHSVVDDQRKHGGPGLLVCGDKGYPNPGAIPTGVDLQIVGIAHAQQVLEGHLAAGERSVVEKARAVARESLERVLSEIEAFIQKELRFTEVDIDWTVRSSGRLISVQGIRALGIENIALSVSQGGAPGERIGLAFDVPIEVDAVFERYFFAQPEEPRMFGLGVETPESLTGVAFRPRERKREQLQLKATVEMLGDAVFDGERYSDFKFQHAAIPHGGESNSPWAFNPRP